MSSVCVSVLVDVPSVVVADAWLASYSSMAMSSSVWVRAGTRCTGTGWVKLRVVDVD